MRTGGFFDSDHAGCLETRRSTASTILYVNKTPVMFYLKRQATVESSAWSSEIVAARLVGEQAIDLRYRLRMLGVKVLGPTVLFGDNQGVMYNVSEPQSTLKKRHQAVAYHRIWELVAANVIRYVWCRSEVNLADMGTKCLTTGTHLRLLHNPIYPPPAQNVRECQPESTTEAGTESEKLRKRSSGQMSQVKTRKGHFGSGDRLRHWDEMSEKSPLTSVGTANFGVRKAGQEQSVFPLETKTVQILHNQGTEWREVEVDVFNIMDRSPQAVRSAVGRSGSLLGPGKRSCKEAEGAGIARS